MKVIVLFVLLLVNSLVFALPDDPALLSYQDNPAINKTDCSCKGKKLYGDVKIVEHGSVDFEVRTVEAFQDINVQTVDALPNECGKWRFIESGRADFTIRFVEHGSVDFEIRFVTALPGIEQY